MFPGWVGWLDTDNKTISVQLNLTGTELGKKSKIHHLKKKTPTKTKLRQIGCSTFLRGP